MPVSPELKPFRHTAGGLVCGVESPPPEPGAPTLVFCPGNGFTAESYLPALAPLAERVGLLAWNPPGFGGSALLGGAAEAAFPGVAAYGDALAELLEARTAGPLVLAGHSIGGWFALRAAAQLAARLAKRVQGLVLLDPLVMGRMEESWPPERKPHAFDLEIRTRERRAHWPSQEEAAEQLRSRPVYANWDAEAFAGYLATGFRPAAQGGVELACPPWLEAAIYGTRSKEEVLAWCAGLQKHPVPAVLVAGTQSDVTDAEGLEGFAARFAAASVLMLPGDHFFPLVRPSATARAMATGLDIVARGLATTPAADSGTESGSAADRA